MSEKQNKRRRLEERKQAVNAALLNNGEKFYLDHGEVKGKNGNFHCWNEKAHSNSKDANPSLSISPETGQYLCHGCGIKGNPVVYYKENIAGASKDMGRNSYLRHMDRYYNLGLYAKNISCKALNVAGKHCLSHKTKELQVDASRIIQPSILVHYDDTIKAEVQDKYIADLLADKKRLASMCKSRGWTPKAIETCGVGFDLQKECFTFPLCNWDGEIVNLQEYRPWKKSGTTGKWYYRLEGRKNPPFNLKACNENKIFITEGQPDCVTLVSHGYNAMTFGAARKTINLFKVFGDLGRQIFEGKEVFLCLDSDEAGQAAVKSLTPQLLAYGCKLKVLNIEKRDEFLEGLDPVLLNEVGKRLEKDVTDLFKKYGFGENSKSVFDKLISITPYETGINVSDESNEPESDKPTIPTDTQFAEEFLEYYLTDQRLVFRGDSYFLREDIIYKPLRQATLKALMYQFIQQHEVFKDVPGKNITPQKINSYLGNLQGLCFIEPEQPLRTFISGKMQEGDYLAMNNGILNLDAAVNGKGSSLLPHTDDYFTTTALSFDFDPTANCPEWKKVLDTIIPDERLQKILQEWFGYCLTSDLRYQKFLILVGEGSNGKSVILLILTALLGEANVSSLPLEQFDARFQLYTTYGKMANIAPEIGHVDRVCEGLLKAYSAGDPIVFEKKWGDSFTGVPTAKLVFGTNQVPRFYDKSRGIWRRLLLLPFDIVIPDEQQDKQLPKHLIQTELPGIFNWALEGLQRLR
ncbi:MAG: hypothetical protein HQK83_14895, partial [Fibrobacteria bacterium]|nr:hypothetical protein [Fibrobacteria bacterium]